MRLLCLLYKFCSTGQPSHIHNLLPQIKNSHRYRNTCRTEYFKNYFFRMTLMNGINLIQTFVALVLIITS